MMGPLSLVSLGLAAASFGSPDPEGADIASIVLGAEPERVERGQPLAFDMTVRLKKPFRAGTSVGPIRQIRLSPVLEVDCGDGRAEPYATGFTCPSYALDDTGTVYRCQFVILVGGTPQRPLLRDAGEYTLRAGVYPLHPETARGEVRVQVLAPSSQTTAALQILDIEKDWPFLRNGSRTSPKDPNSPRRLAEALQHCGGSPIARYAAVRLAIEDYDRCFAQHNNRGGIAFRTTYAGLRRAFELPAICPVRAEAITRLVCAEIIAGDVQDAMRDLDTATQGAPPKLASDLAKIREEVARCGPPTSGPK